jgi:hypothetical protein
MSILVKEPMYQQLNNHLRMLVRPKACAWDRFLTEGKSANASGWAGTANKALFNLVSRANSNSAEDRHFRTRPRLDYNLRALVSFTVKAIAAGKNPSTQVLQFESVTACNVLDEVPEVLRSIPPIRFITWRGCGSPTGAGDPGETLCGG